MTLFLFVACLVIAWAGAVTIAFDLACDLLRWWLTRPGTLPRARVRR